MNASPSSAAPNPAPHHPPRPKPDPYDLVAFIGIATMAPKEKRHRSIAATERGVSLVEARSTTEGDKLTLKFPPCQRPSLAPDLSAGLMAQQTVHFSMAAEVQTKFVDLLAAKTLLLPRSERWREALSTALVGDWSAPLWTDGHLPFTAIGALKAEARLLHRQLVPLWRRRTRHGRVLSLDACLGNGLSLYDLVAADIDLLERVTGGVFDDERLNSVLRSLTPGERHTVLALAEGEATTWAEAATCAGALNPHAFGERVRRKTKRLAAEQRRRIAQRQTLHQQANAHT